MSHVLRVLEKWLPQEKLFRETISLQYEEPHKDRKFRQTKKRMLHGFVILRNQIPIDILDFEVEPGFWSGVTALGYAASLSNQGCLGIQTGHRPKQCDRAFSYLKIDTILSMKWQADPAFRNGEACLWLVSQEAEYALTKPFHFYETLWKRTVISYRPWDSCPHYQDSRLTADPPHWWPSWRKEEWDKFLADFGNPQHHSDHHHPAIVTLIHLNTQPFHPLVDCTGLSSPSSHAAAAQATRQIRAVHADSSPQIVIGGLNSHDQIVGRVGCLMPKDCASAIEDNVGFRQVRTPLNLAEPQLCVLRSTERQRIMAVEGTHGLELLADVALNKAV